MASMLRLLFCIATASAAAAPALAQQTPQPRPAFCLVNGLEGQAVTAEIRAGKASTKIRIPAGQNACCVKFCADNPAAPGYRVTLTAQPAGGKAQQLCTASVETGRVLRVSGSIAQARCEEGRL